MPRARYLTSTPGRAALASFGRDLESLAPTALATRLRREFDAFEAGALGEQFALRARAREKLGDAAAAWLLESRGLEMMTHPLIAARRARRMAHAAVPVIDLTCGIGGDLAALAATGARAVGLDRDPVAARLAAANVPGAAVVRGDAADPPFTISGSAVLVDPSRRDGRGRTFDPTSFFPPWDVAVRLVAGARLGVLKAPPGIDHRVLPAAAEVEFVQVGRVLRECACWLGVDTAPGLKRAVLLPGEHVLDSAAPECPADPVAPGAFILDPRSCVTRAGLVRHLGARMGARLLDPSVAYLSCDQAASDPLAETFEVLDAIPFSLERIRVRLRERHWVPRDVRRRAFPIEPDDLVRRLGRFEGEPVTLLCTTLAGRKTVFVVRAVSGER